VTKKDVSFEQLPTFPKGEKCFLPWNLTHYAWLGDVGIQSNCLIGTRK
jgi:hypothetical protein